MVWRLCRRIAVIVGMAEGTRRGERVDAWHAGAGAKLCHQRQQHGQKPGKTEPA